MLQSTCSNITVLENENACRGLGLISTRRAHLFPPTLEVGEIEGVSQLWTRVVGISSALVNLGGKRNGMKGPDALHIPQYSWMRVSV
jgi:hypothetical protein